MLGDQQLLFEVDDPAWRVSDAASSTFAKNLDLPVHRWFRYSAGFSAEWVQSVIREHSRDDQIAVFDPFAGSGQTLKVAKRLGRKYVGYETIEKYVQLARARVKGISAIRPQQLIARFDKIGKDDPAGQSS